MAAEARVVVRAQDEASKTLDNIRGSGNKLTSAFADMAKVAGGFVIGQGLLKLPGLFSSTVGAASDLQQSIGGVESVFKDASATIFKFGDTAAKSVGLSKNQFNQLASATGAFLKNYGFDADMAANKTIDLTQRASDMAATFGGSVADAMSAIQAGLRGQADPLERYGVAINAAKVEMEALAMTGKAAASELTDQEKMAARLELVFRQTADSAGQFGRESDTLAGKQERLRAQMENTRAEIGEKLLPVQLAVTQAFLDAVGPISQAADKLGQMASGPAAEVARVFKESLIPAVQAFATEAKPKLEEFARFAQEQFRKFQGYYETDLKPAIDNIVTAVKFVVEQIREHWGKIEPIVRPIMEQVRNVVEATMKTIKLALQIVIDLLGGDFSGAWNKAKELVKVVVDFWWESIKNGVELVKGAIGLMKQVGKDIIDGLDKGIREMWQVVIDFFAALPGRIVGFIGDAGQILFGVGKAIIEGLWDGMVSMLGWLEGNVSGIAGKITSWKGPLEKDMLLLFPAGQAIIDGLWNGMETRLPTLKANLEAVAKLIQTSIATSAQALQASTGPQPWYDQRTGETHFPAGTSPSALDPIRSAGVYIPGQFGVVPTAHGLPPIVYNVTVQANAVGMTAQDLALAVRGELERGMA